MPVLVSTVLDASAALVNDPNKVTYTYTKQLPYFRIVYELAQNRLIQLGHPAISEVSAVATVGIGESKIVNLDAFPFRDIVLEPVRVFERPVGGSDNDWEPMTRVGWEENRTAGEILDSWAWREGELKFTPATVAREVKLHYRRVFSAIVDETTAIEHPNFASFLKHATAGYIAEFAMKDTRRADSLNSIANGIMESTIATAVKTMQYSPAKRRPLFFRGRR